MPIVLFFVSMIVFLRKQRGNLRGRKEAGMKAGVCVEVCGSVR